LVEKAHIRFPLHYQSAVRKEDEDESECQIEPESAKIGIHDDPSEEHEELAPEELLGVRVRVLPGDLEKAEPTCRSEHSWRQLTVLLLWWL
jgi:hypothetical protein